MKSTSAEAASIQAVSPVSIFGAAASCASAAVAGSNTANNANINAAARPSSFLSLWSLVKRMTSTFLLGGLQ